MRWLYGSLVLAATFCGGFFDSSLQAAGVNGRLIGVTVFTPSGTYTDGMHFLNSPTNSGTFQETAHSGTGTWGQVFLGSITQFSASWGVNGMGARGYFFGYAIPLGSGPTLVIGYSNSSVNGNGLFIGQ